MSDNTQLPPSFGSPSFPPVGSPFDDAPEPEKRGRRAKAPKAPKAPKSSRKSKAPKEDRAPVRRVASANRTVGLLLALAAMVIMAVAFTAKSSETYVVRANVAIGSLQVFSISDMSAFATAKANIQDGAITASSAKAALALAKHDLANTYAQFPIAQNEQISTTLFSVNTVTSGTGTLDPSMRLMAIQADIGAAAAGVRVGSYVDVIAVTSAVSPAIAGVVLSHVEVVAVAPPATSLATSASSSTSKIPATSIGGTYVLRIPAREETRLAVVAGTGGTVIFLTYASSQPAPGGTSAPGAATSSVIQAICGTNDPLHESGASTQALPASCG